MKAKESDAEQFLSRLSPCLRSAPKGYPCDWWRRGRVELPVQKKLSRIYYKLSPLFVLAWLTPADRVTTRPTGVSFVTLTGVGMAAPQLFVTQSQPAGVGSGWMRYLVIRQRKRIRVRQLCFATIFTTLMTSSACNPAIYSNCRTHAPPCWREPGWLTSFACRSSPGGPALSLFLAWQSPRACHRASCPLPALFRPSLNRPSDRA